MEQNFLPLSDSTICKWRHYVTEPHWTTIDLLCSKSGLEKAMKFALSGLLTSLSRHFGLEEAKYLSRIGFRNRPLISSSSNAEAHMVKWRPYWHSSTEFHWQKMTWCVDGVQELRVAAEEFILVTVVVFPKASHDGLHKLIWNWQVHSVTSEYWHSFILSDKTMIRSSSLLPLAIPINAVSWKSIAPFLHCFFVERTFAALAMPTRKVPTGRGKYSSSCWMDTEADKGAQLLATIVIALWQTIFSTI